MKALRNRSGKSMVVELDKLAGADHAAKASMAFTTDSNRGEWNWRAPALAGAAQQLFTADAMSSDPTAGMY